MDDFLPRYSAALNLRLATIDQAAAGGVQRNDLSETEDGVMLDLARLVAHKTERKNAPLSTYLAGKFVAAWVTAGGQADAGSAAAMAVAEEILGPLPD